MKRRLTIGFAGIADYGNSIAQNLLSGIQKAVEDYDLNLVNFFSATNFSLGDDIELFDHYRSKFGFMSRQNLDGLISWASSFLSFMGEEEIVAIHRQMRPLPQVALGIPLLPDVPGVYTDEAYDIGLVMDHLVLDRGYERIAFFGLLKRSHYLARMKAYRNWLSAHGMRVDESALFLAEDRESPNIKGLVDRFLRAGGPNPPLGAQAIVTVSDLLANPVVSELAERGLRVPEDIAVTGFNNQIESMNAVVPLTTVDPRFYERGYRGVELLVEAIVAARSGRAVQTLTFPSRLVVRQSTGSFEDPILEAGSGSFRREALADRAEQPESEEEWRSRLAVVLKRQCPSQAEAEQAQMIAALADDFAARTAGALLAFLRTVFSRKRSPSGEESLKWQMALSLARAAILDLRPEDPARARRMEDLFHQARVLIFMLDDYRAYSRRYDSYKFNTIAKIAVDFASASSGPHILRMIRSHMDDLEMPSIFLVLQDRMSREPVDGRLCLAYPTMIGPDREVALAGMAIPAKILKLDAYLPKERRFSLMLEMLFHEGKHMGYALIEVGPANIALYDTMRMLLSRTLHANYQRESRDRKEGETQPLLRVEKIRSILEEGKARALSGGIIAAGVVLEYLAERVDRPTDLGGIAADLGVSKSHLMHRTKQLTGYSVQVLHELLKIERAKALLSPRDVRIAEVASRLGFQNPGYFAKVFKKRTGMSPKEWNRKHSFD